MLITGEDIAAEEGAARLQSLTEREVYALRKEHHILPGYRMIDSCAGEFDSYIPYFYSTYEPGNESLVSEKKKIVVLGSGSSRIRRCAVENGVTMLTALDTVRVLPDVLEELTLGISTINSR